MQVDPVLDMSIPDTEERLISTKFIHESCIYKKKNDVRRYCGCPNQYSNLSGKMTGAIKVQPKMP
jgi:hypothetical protein